MLYNVLYMCLLSMSNGNERQQPAEQPARKKLRLVRPPLPFLPPPSPAVNVRKVTTKPDFVKLTCNGHAIFRPNLHIECTAESLPGPYTTEQHTQTEEDRPVPDAQPTNSADADTGPLAPFPNPFNLDYFPNLYPDPNPNPLSALLDSRCPRCGG